MASSLASLIVGGVCDSPLDLSQALNERDLHKSKIQFYNRIKLRNRVMRPWHIRS